MDEGLLNKRSVEVLKNLKLPLPSKLKNEVQLNYFADFLTPNKAIIYKEHGVNKAVKKNKDPNRDTRKQIKVLNILGQYINNIDSLVKYAKKKKQDKESSTSTTLNNLSTDLNYLPDPSLLETIE